MKQDTLSIAHDGALSDSSRILLIKAKGGLGNRILSAVTGLVYADLTGRLPIIDWRDGAYAAPGVNAYPLLFRSPLTLQPEKVEALKDTVPEIWRGHLHEHPTNMIARNDPKSHSSPLIYRKYCVDLSRLNTRNMLAVYWSYLPKLRRLRHLMASNPQFVGIRDEDIFKRYLDRYFRPNQRILFEVDNLLGTKNRPVIGVHIRHTDLAVPVSAVRAAVDNMIDQLHGASIFLATDSDAIQKEMEHAYSNVFYFEKWFAPSGQALHHNKKAPDMIREAENALIDMWALSRCDRLIYSMRSTFSHASRLIGEMPAQNVVDIDARNIPVILKRYAQNYL